MNIAYVRVSTVDQNEARQIEALEKYGIKRWYTEKISGKDANRPKLQEMLEYVREGTRSISMICPGLPAQQPIYL